MTQSSAEKLYEACYMRVFSYVMTLTGDRGEAEEITQETMFRAISDEVTWLCAIAKNTFLDEQKRRARHTGFPEEMAENESGMEQKISDRDSSFRIHLALHALEEPYREVFELRVFGELSFREIGTIFGKTENWARVTYHRAKLKLRERMEQE